MCRSDSTFRQPEGDDWKKTKHLLQTVLADSCSWAGCCESTGSTSHHLESDLFLPQSKAEIQKCHNLTLYVSSFDRLSWFSPSFSSNQPAMSTTSSLPGLRGSAGSLPWAPSSGFLWVLFTHCGCCLAHWCRWYTFTICFSPPKTLKVVHGIF